MNYEEKIIKGKINQIISDIKKINGDKAFHFALADELDSGELNMVNLMAVHPEVFSLGYFHSLSPENQQKVFQSEELEKNEWAVFREYADFLESRGITEKLVHSYPLSFPNSLLPNTYHCFIAFFQHEEKFFFKRKFKGHTLEKEIDLFKLEKIGKEYRRSLENKESHSIDSDFQRLGNQLFHLFLEDEFIAQGLKRIYIDIPVAIAWAPHRQIFEDLPFEIFYSETYHFLLTQKSIPVIRTFSDAPAPPSHIFHSPFKLLVIISNPLGLDESQQINVEKEKRIFYKNLDPLVYEGKLEIDVIDLAAHDQITSKLRCNHFDAVHFLGHGGEEGILLESTNGQPEWVSCAQFASLFTGADIRLFFLTSCLTDANTVANQYSSTVRELRKVGIPIVVGMRQPLTFKAAEILIREFYLGFFQSSTLTLLDAFTQALNKIAFDSHPQIATNAFIPSLYMPVDWEPFGWDEKKQTNEQLALRYYKFDSLGNLKNHTTGCYGREDELRQTKRALQNSNHRILIVKGIGGIGKSAFIYRLCRDLYSDYNHFFVKEFRTETMDKDYDIHSFFAEFNEVLVRNGDSSLQQKMAGGKETYETKAICKHIASAVERMHMFLVLENVEQLLLRGEDGKFRFKDHHFLDLVEALLNSTSCIRLVVGTRDSFECPTFENTPALKYETLLAPILSNEHIGSIAVEADPDMAREKREVLIQYSGGYPLLIQLMAKPRVKIAEIQEMDMDTFSRAASNDKLQKVFEYLEQKLREPERKALFSLSFTVLPFDRGLVEKCIDKKDVDQFLQFPVFHEHSTAALYSIPTIIARYFIETYGDRYGKKAIGKIHKTYADYYRQILEDFFSGKLLPGSLQKFLIINGSHIPDRLIKLVIYHYLEAHDYKNARDVTIRAAKILLDTGSAPFLEFILITLKEKIKAPDTEVDFHLAEVSNELYKFDRSQELYLSLIDRMESEEKKARIFQDLGKMFDNKQDYTEAIQWYQKSAAIFEEFGDKENLVRTYLRLATSYEKNLENPIAIQWYDKSFTLSKEMKDFKSMVYFLTQKSLLLFKMEKYPEAFLNIISAITFAEKEVPHSLKIVQDHLNYFYFKLGAEKSREILNSIYTKPTEGGL